jgi:asparagine synthase (glutamine-hydrolysing)
VPVGVFLSAGIDSSVIAALAAELRGQLRTVTLAFDEYAGTPDDEAPLAEATAKSLGSDHTTVRIGPGEFEQLLDDFLLSMDQPTIDGLNTYLVSRAAAMQGLKVALSGVGGDELFGGYPSFKQIPGLVKWGQYVPSRKPLGRAVQSLLRAIRLPGMPPKAAGLLVHCGDVASAYLLRRALYLEGELDALLDKSWIEEGVERLSTVSNIGQTVERLNVAGVAGHAQIAALESCWYMRNQLLRDTDWSSMAHGLEARVPFVDATLLERIGPAIASAAPPRKRDLAGCARRLPAALLNRGKTGFTTPVRQWISSQTGGAPARGLRGWAGDVHRLFNGVAESNLFPARAAA